MMGVKSSTAFIRGVFHDVSEALRAKGFTKCKPSIFTLRINEEASGWVGLNKALPAGGFLQINPVVGVRHHELESVVSELLGQPKNEYIPPSISTNIGYLTPARHYVAWSFREGEPTKTRVDEIIGAIERHGIGYMQENATLPALLVTLLHAKRGTAPDQLDYRAVIALLLSGNSGDAVKLLSDRLEEIGDRTDAAAELFRRFAAKVRERVLNLGSKYGESGNPS